VAKIVCCEWANNALFLSDLWDYFGLQRPDPSQANEESNTYVIASTRNSTARRWNCGGGLGVIRCVCGCHKWV
jgi:hypothetical protein